MLDYCFIWPGSVGKFDEIIILYSETNNLPSQNEFIKYFRYLTISITNVGLYKTLCRTDVTSTVFIFLLPPRRTALTLI